MNPDLLELDLPKDFKGQMVFKYTQIFSPEEMGIVAPSQLGKFIELSEKFMSEELGIKGTDFDDLKLIKKIFSVFCPFCKKGFLRLKNIVPAGSPVEAYSQHPQPGAHWSGLEYKFDCCSKKGRKGCGAAFSGIVKQFQCCVL